ncbi:CcdB family protein [Marinobacterium mangrovicola]|uniref:CcdB family protein n=1 Tax=Marinobacterium mangrovicola TaxID=1476959 RepID=UPI001FB5108F|nr:CcdB family protein [Marinobacterium mangrovicola]
MILSKNMDASATNSGSFDGAVRCIPQPKQDQQSALPYLVYIQSSLLSELATRIVIPLGKRSAFGSEAMQGITPEISFADQELLLLTPQISSVSEKHLKNRLARYRTSETKLSGHWTWLSPAFNAVINCRKKRSLLRSIS